MKTLRQPINIVFLIQVVVVFLVAFGILPRIAIIPLAILIAIFVLLADLETSTAFFIRSVPIFVAIPITSYFDSFNIWRIASGLIFLKWLYKSKSAIHLPENSRALPLASLFIIFLLTSILSLLAAEDLFSGIKRIIYLINLSLVPLVIYDLIKKSPDLTRKFLSNILISGAIVAGVGLLQLISAYLVPLYAFVDFWVNTQLGFYGQQWAKTALEANTWFAYFGDQLSLRIFSTFTDSHSFPIYILMSIPALLYWAQTNQRRGLVKSAIHPLENSRATSRGSRVGRIADLTRASQTILLLCVFYLLAILSGTRGIWLAVLGPLLALPFLIRRSQTKENKSILKRLGLILLPFFIMFAAAFPIMGSNQFWVEKENSEILAKRIRSILDLNETSNSGRIEIWKKTTASIVRRPLLGVGIGNFPTVLGQHTDLAKAGSSAHNLYLNIAAEIGLIGLAAALGILAIILKRAWLLFTERNGVSLLRNPVSKSVYAAAFLLYSLWVLFYSLTDAVLFDERAFLVFAINSAIILGLYKKIKSPLYAD